MNQSPASTVAVELDHADTQLVQRLDSSAAPVPAPHEIEHEVQRRLQHHPALKFTRLHVHRCEAGICLEGFLESNEFEIDLCDVVRDVVGVTGVLNRVVLARPGSLTPKKG